MTDEEDLDSSMSHMEHLRACALRAREQLTADNAALLILLRLRLTDDPFVE